MEDKDLLINQMSHGHCGQCMGVAICAVLYMPFIVPCKPIQVEVYPAGWRPWETTWLENFPSLPCEIWTQSVVHVREPPSMPGPYKPPPTSSVTVRTRHSAKIGNYRVTRTKTTHRSTRQYGLPKRPLLLRGRRSPGQKTTVRRGRR